MQKYENIPVELKALPNWVCWKAVPDERSHSGVSKKPVNALTGELAKSNDPSTWTTFDNAVKAAPRWSGLGFMFGNCDYFGVDVDDVREDIGIYREGGECIVSEFISTLASYAELSQSGNGIHIICRGHLPPRGRRRGNVEMYEEGRFFVMTGDRIGETSEIRDCTESIKALHEKYIGGGRDPVPKPLPVCAAPQTADGIVRLACNSKNGERFRALWSGDFSGYPSHSEADMAFCSMLAFWTGCDSAKMDAIFRQSGLMREKWDRKQSGSTYGVLTIQRAIASCGETYSSDSSKGFSVNIKSAGSAPISVGEDVQTPVKSRIYSFDDMGNARRFCDLFGEDVRYSYIDKRWYKYDGRRWAADNAGTVERLADLAAEAMKPEAVLWSKQDEEKGTEMLKAFEKHCKASRSNKSKRAMLTEVQHHLPIQPSQTDKHKFLLNTPSGVINLKTGQTGGHKQEYYMTKITGAEYSQNADCPRWTAFLREIFGGDGDLIRYVQKAVGYSLTGSTAEQCVFFLYGTGRNGKSTFLEVIRQVFGDYCSNIQPETIMVKHNQGSAINSDIARLKGARLVTSVEPNEGARLNEGLLKQLTGDDVVTARKLYGDEFEFRPEFKLWMATNHKPIIRGTDVGIWRRIHLVPFTVQIPPAKVDRQLKYKLAAELPGIFRWAVEGCLMWQREGLKMPRAVADGVREYRREMDVISAFIEDRCTVGAGKSVQSSRLYAAYCEWAERGNEYRMSATKFSLELSKKYERIKCRDSNYFNGIALDET